ncbi:unnamed protein product, partial [Iphiclides podalirius]
MAAKDIFKPKVDNEAYGYLLCGDYQHKLFNEMSSKVKFKHSWFRIPCIGNTWSACTEWQSAWDCPIEVTLPPTVPARTTFTNFMLSNKLEIPMYFKFEAPFKTNFVILPMCGTVPGRGWQIISVALEPMSFGEYYESWDLFINRSHKVIPKTVNLHDVVVDDTMTYNFTLYNYGSCFFTSKLYYEIDGMGDDFHGDKIDIDPTINSLKPSNHCEVTMTVSPHGAGPRQVDLKYTVLYRSEYGEVEEIQPVRKSICVVWYDGIYPTLKVKRTISVKCPIILSDHCLWNIVNVGEFNRALMDVRPNKPLNVNLHAPDLCVKSGEIEFIFVLGCIYSVPVPWSLRRKKICDCAMVEPENPNLLFFNIKYGYEGLNTLCFTMTMPNHRTLNIYVNMYAHLSSKGVLVPFRRYSGEGYLAVLDCGRVPINNLNHVIRIAWLYNPTEVFTTWRLLRSSATPADATIRCLQYFAEVSPLDKLAIPFAFLPTQMIDYEATFLCSFGYDVVRILVKGQGGLPNCIETRLDVPSYVERNIRSAYRSDVIYLSKDHITLPIMPTHSLTREIIAIKNDTESLIRFIWLPERVANIINIVMTPWWGVIQPKSTEWITMTVYTLQEPATFTTTISCEVLDLTERRRYQRNEHLRKAKIEQCNQEFIITEEGLFHPGINDNPPYVLNIAKPQSSYLAMSVSISSKGQRDGYPRMLLKQMWEQTPPYDLLSTEIYIQDGQLTGSGNNMTMDDIIRIIEGILWEALHSKLFKYQIQHYSKEEIPTYEHLVTTIESESKPKFSKRITSGICDAIVNKAVFNVYSLNSKSAVSILEAE